MVIKKKDRLQKKNKKLKIKLLKLNKILKNFMKRKINLKVFSKKEMLILKNNFLNLIELNL